MLKPSVGDLRVAEGQIFEARQPFEMFKPCVSYLCVIEPQRLKITKPFEMLKPSVGYLRAMEVQTGEFRQYLQVTRFVVAEIVTGFVVAQTSSQRTYLKHIEEEVTSAKLKQP